MRSKGKPWQTHGLKLLLDLSLQALGILASRLQWLLIGQGQLLALDQWVEANAPNTSRKFLESLTDLTSSDLETLSAPDFASLCVEGFCASSGTVDYLVTGLLV